MILCLESMLRNHDAIFGHISRNLFLLFFPVQPAYENYSFEELRYASPALQRQSETMLVRPNNDGTYSANWTPGNVGFYQIHVVVDGCEMPEPYKVEVINLFNFLTSQNSLYIGLAIFRTF